MADKVSLSSPFSPFSTILILFAGSLEPVAFTGSLRRILLARRAADVLDDFLAVALLGSGFLSHLHSLVVTMCQKPSLIKSTQTVLLALTSDVIRENAPDLG